VLIEPKFEADGNYGDEFESGLIHLSVSGGRYMDINQNLVIDKSYSSAWDFSEGLAAAMPQHGDKWGYIDLSGTTNPIESTFATVRLRTTKTRGCVSRAGLLAMVFKLTKTAEQNWRTLKGHALLAQLVAGVKFKDGLQECTHRIAA
jgi:putative transposase